MEKAKHILISPLDWGLGHTTRIIPVIEDYISDNCKITVACNNFQKQVLEKEISGVSFVDLKGYNIQLSQSKNQTFSILKQIPKILKAIKTEKQFIANFIKSNKVDLIISDNRYGFRSDNVKSVLITHQTCIQTPLKIKFFEKLLNNYNTKIINKFNECWVPDFEGDDNISGDLSHKNTRIKNIKYIGILSRFEKQENTEKTNKLLAIISGPEPQRSIFEELIIIKFSKADHKSIIVRGTNNNAKQNTGKITFINIANTKQLQELINKSEQIISRSGYSSIMDYVKLERTATLVPTPGQTEQEYLAKYLSQKRRFDIVLQDSLKLRDL